MIIYIYTPIRKKVTPSTAPLKGLWNALARLAILNTTPHAPSENQVWAIFGRRGCFVTLVGCAIWGGVPAQVCTIFHLAPVRFLVRFYTLFLYDFTPLLLYCIQYPSPPYCISYNVQYPHPNLNIVLGTIYNNQSGQPYCIWYNLENPP